MYMISLCTSFVYDIFLAATGGPEYVVCGVYNLTILGVSWGQPHPPEQNGPIEQYWIFVWNTGTNVMVYNYSATNSDTLLVNSLLPYHNYKCKVAAYSQYGLGPFTSTPVWITELG